MVQSSYIKTGKKRFFRILGRQKSRIYLQSYVSFMNKPGFAGLSQFKKNNLEFILHGNVIE